MQLRDLELIIESFMNNLLNILESNMKGLVLGIIVAAVIFMIKENKRLRSILDAIVFKDKNAKILSRINVTMKYHNVDFEKAKNIIISEELIKSLRVSKPSWFLSDDRLIYQGHRIAFYDKEVGYLIGDFIGIINSDIDGYDDLYVVKIAKDNSIRQAPISFVDEETLQICE